MDPIGEWRSDDGHSREGTVSPIEDAFCLGPERFEGLGREVGGTAWGVSRTDC
jgi:hypothetical protein